MRIAYVTNDRGVVLSGNNGAATHVREMVASLAARGADVCVVTARAEAAGALPIRIVDVDDEPLLRELRRESTRAAPDATAQAAEIHGLLLNARTLAVLDALHRERPLDLVYERQSLWSLAGLQFARLHGVPFFLEVNAPLVAQQAEYRALEHVATAHALASLLLAYADRIIVPSRGLAAHLVEAGAPAGRIRIVPCGVSRATMAAGATARPARNPTDPFTVGFLGSLKPWHGIELLVQTFTELRRRSDTYRMLVVGDGPMRELIESQCRPEIDAGLVTLTGAVPHDAVPALLARMDAGLAPYPDLPLFYFSPLKLFEYAAAGVPIVASASGQIAELLVHREHALLHKPGSVGKIVKHVELLRTTPDLGPRLARRARRLIATGHTWDRLAARILSMAERAARPLAGSPS